MDLKYGKKSVLTLWKPLNPDESEARCVLGLPFYIVNVLQPNTSSDIPIVEQGGVTDYCGRKGETGEQWTISAKGFRKDLNDLALVG